MVFYDFLFRGFSQRLTIFPFTSFSSIQITIREGRIVTVGLIYYINAAICRMFNFIHRSFDVPRLQVSCVVNPPHKTYSMDFRFQK